MQQEIGQQGNIHVSDEELLTVIADFLEMGHVEEMVGDPNCQVAEVAGVILQEAR